MDILSSVHTQFARACEDKLKTKYCDKHNSDNRKAFKGDDQDKNSTELDRNLAYKIESRMAHDYAEWMKRKHPDCNRLILAHKQHFDREFIQEMINSKECTKKINTYTRLLAFLHNCKPNDVHDLRPMACTQDSDVGRGYTLENYQRQLAYRQEHNNEREADMMRILLMTGLRRDEAEQIRPSNFGVKNGHMFCHLSGTDDLRNLTLPGECPVLTKLEKPRTVEILDKYKGELKNLLSRYDKNEIICKDLSKRIKTEGIRGMYACELYTRFARPIEKVYASERIEEKNKKVTARYRDLQGYVWDRRALLRVAYSLGYDYALILVQKYMWRLREKSCE